MATKFANNAVAKLAAGIGASDTTLVVAAGQGAKFPTVTGGQWYPATLIKVDGTTEIVRVTGRASDTFTVARAQEGTAATTFSTNDRFELRLTTAQLNELLQRDGSVPMTGDLDMGTHKVSGVANATDADDAVNKGQLDVLGGRVTTLEGTDRNGYGKRWVSTVAPTSGDGADGDIWLQTN